MIVPQRKLLLWTAAIILPFATLAALSLELSMLAAVICLGFLLLLLADLSFSASAARRIKLSAAAVLRLSKGWAGMVELELKNDSLRPRQIRLGLPFPEQIRPATYDLLTAIPADAAVSRLRWPCRALERGRFL